MPWKENGVRRNIRVDVKLGSGARARVGVPAATAGVRMRAKALCHQPHAGARNL